MKIRNSYFKKVLIAAGLSAAIAISSIGVQTTAYAATAATDSVMIRNDASTDAGLIGSLNEGDEVEILDVIQSGDGYLWYYIELENGNTGYVRSDLIDASDEELAAFRDEDEDTDNKEEPDEKQEVAQPKPEATPAPEKKEESETGKTSQDTAVTSAEGYDATKDPNANFAVRFETDADGSGNWYVYNEDNGSRIRVSDMQNQENAPAQAAVGGSGIWKTLAILFGLLSVALVAFCLFLLKQIRDGRSGNPRKRVVEAAREDEEESDNEEYFFEDDDEEDEDEEEDLDEESDEDEDIVSEDSEDEEEEAEDEDSESNPVDATITKEITEEEEFPEIRAEEIEAAIAAETAQLEQKISDGIDSEDASGDNGFVEQSEDKEEDLEESEEVEKEIIEEEISNEDEEFEDEDSEEEDSDEESDEEIEEDFEEESEDEEDFEEEEDSEEDEDFEDEDDSEVDEDYEDEDYEDEEDEEDEELDEEDEDFEDEDEDEPVTRRRARSSRRSKKNNSGFMGFFKNLFGSGSNDDDGDDFDEDEDEPVRREFDEFKDYPEDIDLLPKDEFPDTDFSEDAEDDEDGEPLDDGERGRLTMQKVMKNVRYNEREAGFVDDNNMDDLSDSLYDDDDDMEYSFISNTRRK